ncbi:YafY family protein [Adlercreutzia sp. ZJ138]|uniref:helix-turn-helix transcriptional regulator n=1 Tax=Adlercreutzia sp. ZJ138 TaxID=2709405 RepID=UPI0013EAF7B6|nr:WYL domain-containing protein [Adlercreutzia sp. ZJ138]
MPLDKGNNKGNNKSNDKGKKKLKLLLLMRMLYEETDAECGLTMAQIIERLEEQGVSAERKSVYDDINVLRQFGMDVRMVGRTPARYALASRSLHVPEANLIIDAIQSSRFISEQKADELVTAVKQLVGKRQSALLDKRVHVQGRPATQAHSDLVNVDVIQRAIAQKRQVRFCYCKLNAAAQPVEQREGRPYVVTPVDVVYSDGNYYLVAYHESHDDFANYRIDRMRKLLVLDCAACANDTVRSYDPASMGCCAFGMYAGRMATVTLLVAEPAMSAVADRFGDAMQVFPAAGRSLPSQETGEPAAIVVAPVMVSPVLFGWLAQFGCQIRVEKPASVRREYAQWLRDAASLYEGSGTISVK